MPNLVIDASRGKHQVIWKGAEVSHDRAESVLAPWPQQWSRSCLAQLKSEFGIDGIRGLGRGNKHC